MSDKELLILFLSVIWICSTVYSVKVKDGGGLACCMILTFVILLGWAMAHHK
jgi:hypothetical protein